MFYRKLAEIAGEYLKKGSMVYVEGKLQTRKWQDKEGKDRYTTDIIVNEMTMLGDKKSGGDHESSSSAEPARSAAPARQAAPASRTAAPASRESFGSFDDDIPFSPINRLEAMSC